MLVSFGVLGYFITKRITEIERATLENSFNRNEREQVLF